MSGLQGKRLWLVGVLLTLLLVAVGCAAPAAAPTGDTADTGEFDLGKRQELDAATGPDPGAAGRARDVVLREHGLGE